MSSAPARTGLVAPLLFVSGACALVYQVAWLRELRLVFGASSAASAAVLGVFMGGLGFGGLYFGKRVEASKNPLLFYANLEALVAVTAALTPLLVALARKVYLALGGQAALGAGGAMVFRLLLSAFVLAGPTFLMGGTMPAAARAVSRSDDLGRRSVALLYAVNTMGAVLGAVAANFILLEVFGQRLTLIIAALVNGLLAMLGRSLARNLPESPQAETGDAEAAPAEPADDTPRRLVIFTCVAAAIVGFAFLLMELVWYRMLAPLLGGSSYTFGLILALALAGIGIGGGLYSRREPSRKATVTGFAATCVLEALAMAVPLALGDRIAVLTILLRPLGALGLSGHVAAWTAVASIVVVPAAVAAGYQFPILIGLLGRGSRGVGRQLGVAYAANTLGAILGSILGGFLLIPHFGALASWRGTVVLLVATGTVALIVGRDRSRAFTGRAGAIAVLAATTLLLLRSPGPTAAWRHSPIGAGRSDGLAVGATANSLEDWAHSRRRSLLWETDGVESAIAVSVDNSYSFYVNGKSDGSAREDAPTQVMGGLIGAALLAEPHSALVVGLGTGSTAGWLGRVPTIDRVDVVELEPAMVRVARDCALVNEQVLDNARVHVSFGDAREYLLTAKGTYDIIFSEPSNPYRAGVSSLYTQEFYTAASRRLSDDGVFLQWLQVYEVDGWTMQVALATLSSVFPELSVWQTEVGDVVIVAAKKPLAVTADALRARLSGEPYARAMSVTWGAAGLEGFLAHHVAGSRAVAQIAANPEDVNVDDRNTLEYAFARTLGKPGLDVEVSLWATGLAARDDRVHVEGTVDWTEVEMRRAAFGRSKAPLEQAQTMQTAFGKYQARDVEGAEKAFRTLKREPRTLAELRLVAEGLADAGDDEAATLLPKLASLEPADARAVAARLAWARKDLAGAVDALVAAFTSYRTDPWFDLGIATRSIQLAVAVAAKDHALGARLYDALGPPFAVSNNDTNRTGARLEIADELGSVALCVEAVATFEPNVPWNLAFLERRASCYQMAQDPRKADAERDLAAFRSGMPRGLPVAAAPPPSASGGVSAPGL